MRYDSSKGDEDLKKGLSRGVTPAGVRVVCEPCGNPTRRLMQWAHSRAVHGPQTMVLRTQPRTKAGRGGKQNAAHPPPWAVEMYAGVWT